MPLARLAALGTHLAMPVRVVATAKLPPEIFSGIAQTGQHDQLTRDRPPPHSKRQMTGDREGPGSALLLSSRPGGIFLAYD